LLPGYWFLGRLFCLPPFLAQGYTDITALRRHNSKLDLVCRCPPHSMDRRRPRRSFFGEGIAGKQWVFHSAAVVSFHARDVRMMREVDADGTANVVDAWNIVQKLMRRQHRIN